MPKRNRYAVALTVAVMMLGLAAATAAVVLRSRNVDRYANVPFSYTETIERVSPGRYADRRLELHRCVSGWEPWVGVRARLFAAIVDKGLLRHREVVLLEWGHSAWAMYGYVVVVDGALQPSLADGLVASLISVPGPSTPGIEDLRDHVDENVDDGGCHFITVWHKGRPAQAVIYGSLEGSEPIVKFARQLMPAARQQALPKQ